MIANDTLLGTLKTKGLEFTRPEIAPFR